MASFDFVDAAAKSYELLWRERSYLVRVAAPVVFVKMACMLAIHVLYIEDQFLLSGLIKLPGFILEAILAVGLIRYVLYKEPIFIAGRSITAPETRTPSARYAGPMSPTQCVQAGFAMYLLIILCQTAFAGWFNDYAAMLQAQDMKPVPIEPTIWHAMIGLSLLWVGVWMFRLGWLYIPVAMGYSFTAFLRRIKGLSVSFYIFATWFICTLPILILYAGVVNILGLAIPEGVGIDIVLNTAVAAAAEITMVALQVVAMTYGITEILSSDDQKKSEQ
tara:strand:- start:15291 stop:16118 length:828 start_codon:yes stop_codon:yes gene_type:complete